MRAVRNAIATTLMIALATAAAAQSPTTSKWQKGRGWGWVWGPKDEVGALNEMTDRSRAEAMKLAREGKVYDLGAPFDKNSSAWSGHAPTAIMMYRTPHGIMTQKDVKSSLPEAGNVSLTAWHSTAIFMSDNVGTQIDGLAHITVGEDQHFYNGFTARDAVGDFGVMKADSTTIPPIVARAVMIDVAAYRKVDALDPGYEVTVADLQGALKAEKVDITPGAVVLIRTGAMRYWGADGADHENLSAHGSAGIGLPAAKWLVEQKGAMLIGADNEALEVYPPKEKGSTDPVHVYLLVEQGIHIGEWHNLEQLSADHVYEFAYVTITPGVKGTVGGYVMRPLALH